MKYILYFFIVFFGIPIIYLLYLDSDFYESRRLRGQIENNLNITLSKVPEIIYRETYGWAEEGGDIALLWLNKQDCKEVSKNMSGEEMSRETGVFGYYETFKKKNMQPVSVQTWDARNDHGDFTIYALDRPNCILYRRFHYE